MAICELILSHFQLKHDDHRNIFIEIEAEIIVAIVIVLLAKVLLRFHRTPHNHPFLLLLIIDKSAIPAGSL